MYKSFTCLVNFTSKDFISSVDIVSEDFFKFSFQIIVFKNTADFWMLNLYLETLLNLFILTFFKEIVRILHIYDYFIF